ncbi:hypothetical protein [Roseateles toxinivorans]|uniref:Toxin CptA n=1 Tax=Roseateles toxinivorans TaxID=270368 RepID=A0A4R6QNG1_9BURK|nr:hypothetical protein [Roseateles toxinivorans]TDP71452.1 hypothetical protein DES47_103433 [Roseateles toxinivorans]
MRHPPAFQVEVASGRAWCLAWALLVMLASASVLAWLQQWMNLPLVILLLAFLPGLLAGWRLQRQPLQSLRWDGQTWLLGQAASRGGETRQGSLRPMLDLGGWLLLRFADRPERRFGQGRSYLALSRADMPQQWPLLRLTLYSAAGPSEPARHPESPPIR